MRSPFCSFFSPRSRFSRVGMDIVISKSGINGEGYFRCKVFLGGGGMSENSISHDLGHSCRIILKLRTRSYTALGFCFLDGPKRLEINQLS